MPPGMIIGGVQPAPFSPARPLLPAGVGINRPGMEGPRTPDFKIDPMTGMDPNRNNSNFSPVRPFPGFRGFISQRQPDMAFRGQLPTSGGLSRNPFSQLQSLMGYADGGSIPQTEDIPNGMQLDGRGGGFIPMGAKERKDDVPAMLAKNEFVMTADAVRAAGGGDVNKGAQKMYDLMNSLESKV